MNLLDVRHDVFPPEFFGNVESAVISTTSPDRESARNPYFVAFWHELGSPVNNWASAAGEMLSRHLPKSIRDETIGFEWWLGRLDFPYSENFPFGIHRDSGIEIESGLSSHPQISSVFYLSTVHAGPLIVYPGPPAGGKGELFFPQRNSFVMFPGHLWHGVGIEVAQKDSTKLLNHQVPRLSIQYNWWTFRPSGPVDYDSGIFKEMHIPD